METNELIWTKEKPTKAGYYWYKGGADHTPTLHQIADEAGSLEVYVFLWEGSDHLSNKCWDGYWAGPIPEPREAEAAPVYEDPEPTQLHPKPMVCILKPDEFRERGEMYGQQGERGLYVQIVGTSKLKDGTPVYEVQI